MKRAACGGGRHALVTGFFVAKHQKGDNDNFCLHLRELWMPHLPFALRQAEARQHKCRKHVESSVRLGCSSWPWACADLVEAIFGSFKCFSNLQLFGTSPLASLRTCD